MAQSFKFFTVGNMRNIIVQSVTSEVAGRELEFALDHNLDTYWKATSGAVQTLEFDFGEAVTISSLAVFINNYNAAWTTERFDMYWSDNGTSWTFYAGPLILSTALNNFGVALLAPELVATHRYWKLVLYQLVLIPNVGQIFFCIRHKVDTASFYPERNLKEYIIKKQMAVGGRRFIVQPNRIAAETLRRTWFLSGDTDRDALQAMWDDTRGHSLPLVMQEDNGDARIVEIVAPATFSDNKIQHQLYRPTITFRTLPYIEDGLLF